MNRRLFIATLAAAVTLPALATQPTADDRELQAEVNRQAPSGLIRLHPRSYKLTKTITIPDGVYLLDLNGCSFNSVLPGHIYFKLGSGIVVTNGIFNCSVKDQIIAKLTSPYRQSADFSGAHS